MRNGVRISELTVIHNIIILSAVYIILALLQLLFVDWNVKEPIVVYKTTPQTYLATIAGPFAQTILLPWGETKPDWGSICIMFLICAAPIAFGTLYSGRIARVVGVLGILLWFIMGLCIPGTYY